MAKNSPVAIWIIKQSPNSEPKFQNALILAGVGSSTNEPLTIFRRGWVFKIDFILSKREHPYLNLQFITFSAILLLVR